MPNAVVKETNMLVGLTRGFILSGTIPGDCNELVLSEQLLADRDTLRSVRTSTLRVKPAKIAAKRQQNDVLRKLKSIEEGVQNLAGSSKTVALQHPSVVYGDLTLRPTPLSIWPVALECREPQPR
jgi:hypothetical protein